MIFYKKQLNYKSFYKKKNKQLDLILFFYITLE